MFTVFLVGGGERGSVLKHRSHAPLKASSKAGSKSHLPVRLARFTEACAR